jgi:hypothetical protein
VHHSTVSLGWAIGGPAPRDHGSYSPATGRCSRLPTILIYWTRPSPSSTAASSRPAHE